MDRTDLARDLQAVAELPPDADDDHERCDAEDCLPCSYVQLAEAQHIVGQAWNQKEHAWLHVDQLETELAETRTAAAECERIYEAKCAERERAAARHRCALQTLADRLSGKTKDETDGT